MHSRQKISAPLKLMLSALLLIGCNHEEGTISHKVGYLTADLNGGKVEVSEFIGTVVKEARPAGPGVVDLEVKVESTQGEIIEFKILDYQENKIYMLEEGTFNDKWKNLQIMDSSGSLRYCVSGRFFFDSSASESVQSQAYKGRHIY